jgi:hypothetical protein
MRNEIASKLNIFQSTGAKIQTITKDNRNIVRHQPHLRWGMYYQAYPQDSKILSLPVLHAVFLKLTSFDVMVTIRITFSNE